MTRMTLKSGVIAALLLTVGGAAQAVLVGAGGTNPYSFSWSRTVTGFLDGFQHTLTGNGSFTVSGFNSTTLTIVATLNNTSAIGGPDGERLISFAFGIDPNATNVDFVDDADGGMVDAQLGAQGTLGSNVQGVEICAWGGSNCNSGSSGGILGGGSDTFRFILSGTWGSSVNINPVGVKYQARFDAYEFEAAGSTPPPPPPPPPPHAAPEPGALALLGLGVAGLIATRGRKR